MPGLYPALQNPVFYNLNSPVLTFFIFLLLMINRRLYWGFAIRIDRQLPTLVTKKLKLQQVFQNLLSNAIKYIDKPQGYIHIGYEEEGDFYKFYVRDNGPGIASEDSRKIFGLFATTDNRSATGESSTGIGLNIMKVNVEEQGGKVTFESVKDVGSTFYFQWLKKGS